MDAHAREAAAAAQGMRDHTPDPFCNIEPDDGLAMAAFCAPPRPLPAEGDWVNGTTCGRRFSGYVQQAEPGRIVIEVSGAWLIVRPDDLENW